MIHSIAAHVGHTTASLYIVQVSPSSASVWRVIGATGQVSGVRLVTTYNQVDYYLAASEEKGLLLYTEEEKELAPHYEVMFDIVAV